MSRLMDKVIPPQLRNEVFVYLDDLLIVSDSLERHLEVLREVAFHIKRAGLTINIGKSKFCSKRVKYLGHIVGDGGIRMDPEKIAAITEFPVPKTLRSMRSFLGLCGWYRKFIGNFAALTAPLTDLLTPERKLAFTEQALKAFEDLKTRLTEAPILKSADFSKPFFIHCDASKTGVGGVLVQLSDEGDECPIAFVSKKLNKAQQNYSVTEQECLAAIVCLKNFRAYVEGHDFTIITDHASLKWLMSQTDLSSRLARWALKLQSYSFKIEHRRGKLNVVPDVLSRVHEEEVDELNCLDERLVDVKSRHFNSPEYLDLIARIEDCKDRLPDVKVQDGRVFRRAEHAVGEPVHDKYNWKLWIPKEAVAEILKKEHDDPLAAHGGIHKTIERIRQFYFWPGLVPDVKKYVNSCETCKASKAPNYPLRPPLAKPSESERFFQKLYIDFLGPYPRSRNGNIGIFIVLDHLSKFVFLQPVKKITADVVVKYLETELFHVFGVPEVIISDNGSQFRSQTFKKLLDEYNVSHSFTAVHAPQGNAAERVNRSVVAAIRSYVKGDQKDWDKYLSHICCALRSAVHSSVGTSSYYMAFGQQMITSGTTYTLLRKLNLLEDRSLNLIQKDSLEVVRSRAGEIMQQQYENNERQYNLRARVVNFVEGQEVFRRNFKQILPRATTPSLPQDF